MKKIIIYSLKYIPIEIKNQKEKQKEKPKINSKNKLSKENQDYIKEITASGFREI